jgi:heterodisulfide reductase subunit D
VCPTYEAYPFEHYAAGGRIAIARAWFEEFIKNPEEIVEAVFSCLGCGACQEICQAYTEMPFPVPDGIDTPRVMRALRGELQMRGLAPHGIKDLDQSVKKKKNAFAGDMKKKKRLAEQFNLPSQGDTLFFAGCYPFFKDRIKRVEKTLAVLKDTKREIAFLAEEEWCCGILQHADGNEALAKEMALHNLKKITESGAEQVITPCSGCFNALSSLYQRFLNKELPFKVLHTSQYFHKLLVEKTLSFSRKLTGKVTYHDPCHLGRLCKIYEEPRQVLAQIPGLTLIEMERTREKAWCCGGGEGIVSLAYPQLAADIGKERIIEAERTGASVLITTCPHCISQLTIAIKRLKLPITCMDLSEIVSDAIGV